MSGGQFGLDKGDYFKSVLGGQFHWLFQFGVPKNDQRWLKVMDKFLNYLKANGIGGCYWAAGQWWKNYPLSIEPINNSDQPQMLVYAKYLPRFNQNNTNAAKISSNSSVAVLR